MLYNNVRAGFMPKAIDLRARAKIASAFMHHGFRPSWPDSKTTHRSSVSKAHKKIHWQLFNDFLSIQ